MSTMLLPCGIGLHMITEMPFSRSRMIMGRWGAVWCERSYLGLCRDRRVEPVCHGYRRRWSRGFGRWHHHSVRVLWVMRTWNILAAWDTYVVHRVQLGGRCGMWI